MLNKLLLKKMKGKNETTIKQRNFHWMVHILLRSCDKSCSGRKDDFYKVRTKCWSSIFEKRMIVNLFLEFVEVSFSHPVYNGIFYITA